MVSATFTLIICTIIILILLCAIFKLIAFLRRRCPNYVASVSSEGFEQSSTDDNSAIIEMNPNATNSVEDSDELLPLILSDNSNKRKEIQEIVDKIKDLKKKKVQPEKIFMEIKEKLPEKIYFNLSTKPAVDNDGTTLLWTATKCNIIDMIEFLIENGADINIADNNGQTPLMNAVTQNRLQLVKLVVERWKATIEAKDKGGGTALFSAVQLALNNDDKEEQRGYLDIASYLIWQGADVRSIADAHPEIACRYFAQRLHLIPIHPKYDPDYRFGFIGHYPLLKNQVKVEALRFPRERSGFSLIEERSESQCKITVEETSAGLIRKVCVRKEDIEAMVKTRLDSEFKNCLTKGTQVYTGALNLETSLECWCPSDELESDRDRETRKFIVNLHIKGGNNDIKQRYLTNEDLSLKVNVQMTNKKEMTNAAKTALCTTSLDSRIASKDVDRIRNLWKDELSLIWMKHSSREKIAAKFTDPKVSFFLFPIPIDLNFLEACCVSAMGEEDWGAFNNVVVSAAVDHYWEKTRSLFWCTIAFESIYRALIFVTIYEFEAWSKASSHVIQMANKAVVVLILIWTCLSGLSLLWNLSKLHKGRRRKYLWFSLMFYVIDMGAISSMLVAMVARLAARHPDSSTSFPLYTKAVNATDGQSMHPNNSTFSSTTTNEMNGGLTTADTFLSVATVFVWFKTIYYMRPFPQTGYLVKCVDHVVRSTMGFMVILAIVIVGFAQSLYLLSYASLDDCFLIVYQFMIGYASWGLNGKAKASLTVLMVALTWTATVVLLNVLIALMSEAFNDIRTSTKSSASMERAIIVLDHQWSNEPYIKMAITIRNLSKGCVGRCWEHCPITVVADLYLRCYDIRELASDGADEKKVALCIRRKLDDLDEQQQQQQQQQGRGQGEGQEQGQGQGQRQEGGAQDDDVTRAPSPQRSPPHDEVAVNPPLVSRPPISYSQVHYFPPQWPYPKPLPDEIPISNPLRMRSANPAFDMQYYDGPIFKPAHWYPALASASASASTSTDPYQLTQSHGDAKPLEGKEEEEEKEHRLQPHPQLFDYSSHNSRQGSSAPFDTQGASAAPPSSPLAFPGPRPGGRGPGAGAGAGGGAGAGQGPLEHSLGMEKAPPSPPAPHLAPAADLMRSSLPPPRSTSFTSSNRVSNHVCDTSEGVSATAVAVAPQQPPSYSQGRGEATGMAPSPTCVLPSSSAQPMIGLPTSNPIQRGSQPPNVITGAAARSTSSPAPW